MPFTLELLTAFAAAATWSQVGWSGIVMPLADSRSLRYMSIEDSP
jgi:hypothetical protein